MKRDDYLRDRDVQAFLEWAKPLVTSERPLDETGSERGAKFATLDEARREYEWDGKSYLTTVAYLGERARQIREAADRKDSLTFLGAAREVLRWGGVVGGNARRLEALGGEAIPLLQINARLLDPATADLERVWVVQPMSSGFSKLYSLLLDDFPIYDSRVACALGSLVRWFCEETEGVAEVPRLLAFGIPPNQGNASRDPSCGEVSFPKIRYGGSGLHARSNVMAAWVLDELATHGSFGKLGNERQFALQSAMFMIGEQPLAEGE